MRPLQVAVLVLAASTVVLNGLLICPAGMIRHDRSAGPYRDLGNADSFRCVGEVQFTEGGEEQGKAGAVLVAPAWALTVGHVANATRIEDQQVQFGVETYRVVRRVLHPEFDAEASNPEAVLGISAAAADLALLRLDRPVQGVAPACRYRKNDEVGQTATIVGHGYIGNGSDGPVRPFVQERRAGHNVVDAAGGNYGDLTVTKGVLLCDFDAPGDPAMNRIGDAAPVDLEIGASPGDSGGGWFVQCKGRWQLVAVTSGRIPVTGDPYDGSSPLYGSIWAGMRVSTANVWVDRVLDASDKEQVKSER